MKSDLALCINDSPTLYLFHSFSICSGRTCCSHSRDLELGYRIYCFLCRCGRRLVFRASRVVVLLAQPFTSFLCDGQLQTWDRSYPSQMAINVPSGPRSCRTWSTSGSLLSATREHSDMVSKTGQSQYHSFVAPALRIHRSGDSHLTMGRLPGHVSRDTADAIVSVDTEAGTKKNVPRFLCCIYISRSPHAAWTFECKSETR